MDVHEAGSRPTSQGMNGVRLWAKASPHACCGGDKQKSLPHIREMVEKLLQFAAKVDGEWVGKQQKHADPISFYLKSGHVG